MPCASRASPRSIALAQTSRSVLVVAERLSHVADRRPGPVGDHVRDLGGVVAAVALVDVGDDLFAPSGLDVDVYVRRPVTFGGQEALEEKSERDGVRAGDAEGEADSGVGGGPAALAVDVVTPAELDDVPHDEEVAGEPEIADDLELVVELRPRARDTLGVARAVAGECALGARARRARSARCGRCGTGKSGSPGATSLRSKAHALPSCGGGLYRARPAGEPACLLCS